MNLIPFALFSTKVPSRFLMPLAKKKHSSKSIFALYCDYTVILVTTLMITALIQTYSNIYLMTVSTKFTVTFPAMMTFITYPLMLFSYFSICLLISDGMTLGTLVTKQRLMVENEFKQALTLTINAFTLNLLYWRIKDFFNVQDYRYQELMQESNSYIDLHSLLENRTSDEEQSQIYQVAA